MSSNGKSICSFGEVYRAELEAIGKRRAGNKCPELVVGKNTSPTTAHDLTGLALSGGGMRAASFSLGVLQALNAKDVIKRIDYLSTVSGGGYVGTMMSIGLSTNGQKFPFGKEGTDSDETLETRHLRDNSRYLMQNGLPSVVSALAVYLRGIVMNVLIVLPILLALSAALIGLHLNQGAITEPLGRLPYWEITKSTAMPITAYAGIVLLAIWVVYVLVVSVVRIQDLTKRQRLSWSAAMAISIFGLVAILEGHVLLLGKLFEWDGWTETFKWLEKFWPLLASAAVPILPFIKRLGAIANKGSGDSWAVLGKRVFSSVILLFLAAIVPVTLWLIAMKLAHLGISGGDAEQSAVLYLEIAFVLALTWPFISVNANSLHQLYRDRLGTAFLVQRGKRGLVTADDIRLSHLDPGLTPYHLMNTALNIPGNKFANRRGRNADFFLFSPLFIGSEATDYVRTKVAEDVVDRLNIGTAMAISGAAAAPNMGTLSIKPLSPTIAFFNVRLGRWFPHPQVIARRAAAAPYPLRVARWFVSRPGPRYLLREAFSKSGVNLWRTKANKPKGKGFLFLSDGGHIENLGIYELLRRRCRLIIAVDAEADPDIDCRSLVQLERFARIDLDTRITIEWQPIRAQTRKVGEQVKEGSVDYANGNGPHVAVGVIDYPAPRGAKVTAREKGVLIYIKASLSGDENDYILAYKTKYPRFPHESTADQLFSEEQLEAYRSLGEHMTRHFLEGEDNFAAYSVHRNAAMAQIAALLPQVAGSLPVPASGSPAVVAAPPPPPAQSPNP